MPLAISHWLAIRMIRTRIYFFEHGTHGMHGNNSNIRFYIMNTEKPFNRYYFSNTECTELEIPRLTICWYQYFSVFSVISVFVSFMVVNNKPLHFVCFAQSIEKNKRKQKKQKKTVIGYKNKTLKTHKTFRAMLARIKKFCRFYFISTHRASTFSVYSVRSVFVP